MGSHDADEFFRRFRKKVNLVAIRLHAGQKPGSTFHGIHAGGAADIVILGRVVMENQGNLFIFVFQTMEPCPFDGLIYHGGHTFRHGLVFDGAVRQYVTAGDRNPVDRAVKFRQGYGDGSFHRVEAFGIFAPVFFRRQQGVGC